MLQQLEGGPQRTKQVYLLLGPRLDFYWANIVEVLGEVPEFYNYFSPEWVYGQVVAGQMQVWALDDGAVRGVVVSRICVFPRQKVFEIVAAAGNGLLEFVEEMDLVFDRIAASAGCSTIAGVVRPGLARILKKRGGEVKYSVVSRPVVLQREQ